MHCAGLVVSRPSIRLANGALVGGAHLEQERLHVVPLLQDDGRQLLDVGELLGLQLDQLPTDIDADSTMPTRLKGYAIDEW